MDYFANENGSIFNECGYELKQQVRKDGYKTFTLYDGVGGKLEYYVHRFVWEYFNGKIPPNLQIDHINNNKEDNRIDNLRLVSPKFNSQRRPTNKLSLNACRTIKDVYSSGLFTQRDIAEQFDCSSTTIHNCITKKTWN